MHADVASLTGTAAALFQETLDQEYGADKALTKLAEARLNGAAAALSATARTHRRLPASRAPPDKRAHVRRRAFLAMDSLDFGARPHGQY